MYCVVSKRKEYLGLCPSRLPLILFFVLLVEALFSSAKFGNLATVALSFLFDN